MIQALRYATTKRRRSLAAAAELTDEDDEIKKERWRKHIAEISKHLATEPIQSQDLTCEHEQRLDRKMRSAMGKPYRPHKPIEIPYKWIEAEGAQQ